MNNIDIYRQQMFAQSMLKSFYEAYTFYSLSLQICNQRVAKTLQTLSEKLNFRNETSVKKASIPITRKNELKIITELSIQNNSKSTSSQENRSNINISYPFYTMHSRKKEKKNLRVRMNKVVSRVHNTDCLLKKIKAKYLKYLFLILRDEAVNIDTKKFDQRAEVRNLNINHNRNKFLNLTVLELLINNKVLSQGDIVHINNSNNQRLNALLSKKVKNHYQFDFLQSNFFREWAKDPIKILKTLQFPPKNKNCLKYPNHSKNIFRNHENYQIYIKLLIITSCNFILYFQNNAQKYGKKVI